MKTMFAVAAVALMAIAATPAFAQPKSEQGCEAQLAALHKDFGATGISPHVKQEWMTPAFSAHLGWHPRPNPNTVVSGNDGHEHTVAQLTVIRDQMRTAMRLCKDGNNPEAMLRIDFIRHMMTLPELQHLGAHVLEVPPSE